MKKIELLLIIFWTFLWTLFSLLILKAYYAITTSSMALNTRIEFEILSSPLFKSAILIFFSLTIVFFIILKVKRKEIFQNKKIIFSTLLWGILIIVIIFISNSKLEKNILIEGEFPDKNQELQMFNAKFDFCTGEIASKLEIKRLINTIISNNAVQKEHYVQIKYNNIIYSDNNDLVKLSDLINNTNIIYCEYDSDGYINTIIIKDIDDGNVN